LNVYGESYGPIPGLLYAALDPAGVRTIIFDSSTDNQVDIALSDVAAPLDYITELANQCAEETECASQLPDVRSTFIDTIRSLNNQPWVFSTPGGGQQVITGSDVFDAIEDFDAYDFPGLLKFVVDRDTESLIRFVIRRNENDNPGPNVDSTADYRFEADLMHATVQCAAIDAENFGTAVIPTKEQWPDDLLDIVRSRVGYPAVCTQGIIPIEQDLTQREPVSIAAPALILGGALDHIVPLQQVQKLAESFDSPSLAISPKGGHGVGFATVFLEPCVKNIITSFLENPENAPDIRCLADDVEPFLFGDELIESL